MRLVRLSESTFLGAIVRATRFFPRAKDYRSSRAVLNFLGQSATLRRMGIPIVCTLTEAETKERRQTTLDSIRGAVLNVTPLPLGYAYRFEPNSNVLGQLFTLVDLERQCCPFLTFRVIVEAGNQPISLEVTGPPKAKAIIADFFGS
jgi:hypothetical protein